VKILLLPLAIAAFVLFLLFLGAIGFGVAFAVIAAIGRVWRLLSRSGRPRHS
jgi:multidrug transporter EmrE-like cation transporter